MTSSVALIHGMDVAQEYKHLNFRHKWDYTEIGQRCTYVYEKGHRKYKCWTNYNDYDKEEVEEEEEEEDSDESSSNEGDSDSQS